MADNTVLPGTGESYASDDIGGIKFQRVKLVHGADGTNDGDVAIVNPLPVKLQSQDTNAEVSTTPLANGASYTTAWFDTQDAPHGFTVAVKSDVAGHTYHEESPNNDGSNIIAADDFPYTQAEMVAGVDEEHISHTRYSRFKITNDSGSAQTSLIYSVTQRFLDGYGTIKIAASQNDVTAHGTKEHNTATPSTEAVEALTAVAKAAAPTYGEGNMVAPRVTLSGDAAITLDGESVTVIATNLDVRDLTSVSDSVTAVQATAANLKALVDINSSQTLATVTTVGTVTTLTGGGVAHDSPDTGTNPLKIGGRADTTFQAAAADGDRVDALFDVYGVQRVRNDQPNRWSYHEDSASALTDATVQTAPGAGLSVYITDIVFSTGAATACNIFLEEGTTHILGPYYLEAVAGRGLSLQFATPHKCTANTAVTVTTSAAIAHGLDIKGFIAP